MAGVKRANTRGEAEVRPVMWFGRGPLRRIARTANRINRLRPKKRRRARDERPAGPKLVKGRGRPRARSPLLTALVYLLVAAAVVLFLLRYA